MDWVALPVSQWITNQNNVEISFIVYNLNIVNDPAERMIGLVMEIITTDAPGSPPHCFLPAAAGQGVPSPRSSSMMPSKYFEHE